MGITSDLLLVSLLRIPSRVLYEMIESEISFVVRMRLVSAKTRVFDKPADRISGSAEVGKWCLQWINGGLCQWGGHGDPSAAETELICHGNSTRGIPWKSRKVTLGPIPPPIFSPRPRCSSNAHLDFGLFLGGSSSCLHVSGLYCATCCPWALYRVNYRWRPASLSRFIWTIAH